MNFETGFRVAGDAGQSHPRRCAAFCRRPLTQRRHVPRVFRRLTYPPRARQKYRLSSRPLFWITGGCWHRWHPRASSRAHDQNSDRSHRSEDQCGRLRDVQVVDNHVLRGIDYITGREVEWVYVYHLHQDVHVHVVKVQWTARSPGDGKCSAECKRRISNVVGNGWCCHVYHSI